MDKKINNLIEKWQKRNIWGAYCQTKEEAVEKILGLIPISATIGISGSVTLEELGIVRQLEERGNNVFNQYKPGIKRDESLVLRQQGALADYYLASANAISGGGELVFFSAYGNRTSGIAYAKNVLVVCGVNKIVPSLDAAIKRSRELATPLNCKRLNWSQAPCFNDSICRNEICLFPEHKRMCCQILVIEAEIAPGRLKVILVGQNLGF